MRETPRPLWRGLDYGPALVVIDDSDTAPADLPAGWEPLAQRYQIAWCSVAHGQCLNAVEDVLESLADRFTRTHLIARTVDAGTVARVVDEFPDVVRTVVMVGPGWAPKANGVRTVRVAGTNLTDSAVVGSVVAAVEGVRPASLAVTQSTMD
ncbi:hypothetical protein [Alloactinosynnema sp. L-07]|uniref:hypothetical protein n=1 Tax=Alloactinosynnema sp. L-07 TaxID=1653480 RepID=UPI00065EF53F|nr:hypothetical protein [Alloactinosynnema sp. L-07]CRK58310.1 hypothetical protein [Alloactinosynnema sp. L-07]